MPCGHTGSQVPPDLLRAFAKGERTEVGGFLTPRCSMQSDPHPALSFVQARRRSTACVLANTLLTHRRCASCLGRYWHLVFLQHERETRRKRKKLLGVHEKVEQPHAPFNREAFAFVASEHGIYRGRDLHPIGTIQ